MKRYTITQFRNDYPNDDACLDKLYKLRFTGLVCPKCESEKPFVRVKNRRSYQCSCGFQVYPTQGTVFEKTTTPLTYWFYAIFLQTTTRNGVAAKELERQLNVCYKTALRMAHQIKKLMSGSGINAEQLSGIVQADETLIGGALSNRHQSEKFNSKKGKRNRFENKAIVAGAVDESGDVRAKVVKNATKEELVPFVFYNVKAGSTLVTDEHVPYLFLNRFYKHETVNHSEKEYVKGDFHTNTIEGFWSQLKRTIKGTHIKVSAQHLQKYVDEVAFRYAHRKNQDQMFDAILRRVV